jgi:hypothetical protein
VIDLFLKQVVNPEYDEDEDDIRVLREREHEPLIPLKELIRRHGR